ncbi:MAG TPA: 4Fe-4S binding protein [Spirochaetota bacterium]|nr:4Fe-4S binding protein [Spirochaetota bacterium]HPQ52473.1 4Fe-4S binding protein [Spirochaetota bacterium]
MVTINEELCAGCGKCEMVCPEGFSMSDGIALLKSSTVPCIDEVIRVCPVGAVERVSRQGCTL